MWPRQVTKFLGSSQEPSQLQLSAFSSRQLSPLAANLGVVARRKSCHKVVDVCFPGRLFHFFHAHCSLIVTVLDIFSNGTVKKDRLLADNSKFGPHVWKIEGLDVVLFQLKASLVEV